jgi:hypothetical protein
MGSSIGHNERDLGQVIKVSQLRFQLSHRLRSHSSVCRSNLHVDLAILEIGNRVNLIAALTFHVGYWLGDGRVVIIHASGVLPHETSYHGT